MKPDETEWDNVGRDGTTWDEMGRHGTRWDDMRQCGTRWDIYEKANGFFGRQNANHKISNSNTSNNNAIKSDHERL